mgnify:CR=1 FL=1
MDNDISITLKTIKILNDSQYFNNDNICNVYKRLFDKIHDTNSSHNTLFLKIWLNHITEQLSRTAHLLSHCEEVLDSNNQSTNIINQIDTPFDLNNREIETLYRFIYLTNSIK